MRKGIKEPILNIDPHFHGRYNELAPQMTPPNPRRDSIMRRAPVKEVERFIGTNRHMTPIEISNINKGVSLQNHSFYVPTHLIHRTQSLTDIPKDVAPPSLSDKPIDFATQSLAPPMATREYQRRTLHSVGRRTSENMN